MQATQLLHNLGQSLWLNNITRARRRTEGQAKYSLALDWQRGSVVRSSLRTTAPRRNLLCLLKTPKAPESL